MRPLASVIGLVLIAIGIVATLAGEVTSIGWWLIAAAIAAGGIAGLVSALRPTTDVGR